MVRLATISLCAALPVILLAGGASATTPIQKCQEAKLKAQGKLELCLKKNSAHVLGGKPDESATCQSKFQAALTKAGTCRYLDNGDGTVSDLDTGLQWEKKDTTCPGAHCYSDTFTWTASGSPYPPNGTAFGTFLGGLNGGTSLYGTTTTGCFTGHCDWRLPAIEELAGIIDMTQGECSGGSGPCIDPVFGPTQTLSAWSATSDTGFPLSAWIASFSVGAVFGGNKTNYLYVRAVRGGL